MSLPPSPVPESPGLPQRVRCYACARRQDPRREACEKCGVPFCGLCSCGAPRSLFATQCVACGARLGAKRLPRGRHPLVRAARWSLLGGAVLAVGLVVWSRSGETPPWALKERATASYREGRYAEAARDFKVLTHISPRDAEAWFNLALSYRKLAMEPAACLEPAGRAVELAPRMYPAVMLLAVIEHEAGAFVPALEHARAAAALPGAQAEASVLVAQILLAGPDPDIHAVIDALRAAPRDEQPTLEAQILLAECYIWIYGALPSESYPPEVALAMQRARDALGEIVKQGDARVTASTAIGQARILLACGEPSEAWAVTGGVLSPPAGSPGATPGTPLSDDERARLHVLRGRSLLEWKDYRAGARDDFLQAIALSPAPETCQSIVFPLEAHGRLDFAEEILAAAADRPDPQGAVALSLAQVRLLRGKPAEAALAIDAARVRNPQDASIALVLGDVRAAQGDLEGAGEAYQEASTRATGWTLPLVRKALLALAVTGSAAERDDKLRAALAELADLTSGARADGTALRALARLELAAGLHARAAATAARAAAASPGDPAAWLLLGEACLADPSEESAPRAAQALQRARLLAPDDATIARATIDALLRAGDPAAAIASATRFLAEHPDERGIRRLRARAEAQVGRWRDAADDLKHLLTGDPDDVDLALDAAEAEFRAGDPAQARALLDRIDAPAHPEVNDLVSVLRLRIEGFGPDTIVERLRQSGPSAVLARALLGAGRHADARDAARDLLAKAPGDPDATDVLVHAVCDGLPSLEPSDESLADADRAVAALASDAPEWLAPVLRARILLARHDWRGAYEAIAPFRDRIPQRAVPAFVFGAAAFRAGHTDLGVGWVRKSLAFPEAPAGFERAVAGILTEAAVLATDPLRAERFARLALTLDPDNVGAGIRMCDVLAARGDFALAATFAERALQSPLATGDTVLMLRLRAASAQVAAGKPALAAVHIDAAARIDPESGLVQVIRAGAALAGDDLQGAETAIAEARRRMPGHVLVEMQSIAIELARRDPDGALARTQAWLEDHPADNIVPGYAARLLWEGGFAEAAVRLTQSLHHARPNDVGVADALVDLLTRTGRFDDAMEVGRRFAAARGAEDAEAVLVAARAAVVRPSTAEEAAALARAVRARADCSARASVLSWAIEAHAAVRVGSFEAAADAAQRGITALAELQPAAPDVERALRQALGHARLAASDFARAADEFRLCVEFAPTDADDRNNLAWALAHVRGSGDTALQHARRATELRPADPQFWSTRAVAALAANDPSDAETSFRACLVRHEAVPAGDPDGRARAAIRYAEFLSGKGRPEESRDVARNVASWTPAPRSELLAQAAELARR